MRDANETIIRLDNDGDFAEAWTERPGLVERLKSVGFTETQRQGRGAWLRGGIRQIAFRKPPAVGTPARRAASLRGLAGGGAAPEPGRRMRDELSEMGTLTSRPERRLWRIRTAGSGGPGGRCVAGSGPSALGGQYPGRTGLSTRAMTR
jgi:hypothetical protein